VNHLTINLEEARKVVAELEAAHARGFVASEMVLRMHGQVSDSGWVAVKASHLCYKAHPTDGKLNWGCSSGLHEDCYVGPDGLLYDDEGRCRSCRWDLSEVEVEDEEPSTQGEQEAGPAQG